MLGLISVIGGVMHTHENQAHALWREAGDVSIIRAEL
jgi:hypothetical protein